MNFKKIVIKTMAAAMAFGFIGFLNAGTTKAAAAAANITFDGAKEQATIKAEYKYWSLVKEVDEKKKDFDKEGKFYKVEEVFEVVGGKIDLSFLNKGKDVTIAVGKKDVFTADAAWEVKVIKKQSKDFKAAFVSKKDEAGTVSFNGVSVATANFIDGNEYGNLVATDGSPAAEYNLKTAGKTEIKVGKGDWQLLNVFFGKGKAENIEDTGNKADKTFATLLQTGATVSLRTVGSDSAWPSKEVKVKFEKQKKAPKVAVDTTKGVVSFKKGQEYKIKIGATDPVGGWKPVEKKMTFAELGIKGNDDIVLTVRDAAKDKKVASKIAEIKLAKQDKLTVVAATTTGDLVTGKLSLKMKVPYDIKKGAEILNTDKDNEYEYFIIDSAEATAVPPAEAKWHKIKAAKENKKKVIVPGKSSLKFSKDLSKGNAYGEDNTNLKIFVRLAGTKQDKVTGAAKLPGFTDKDNGKNTLVIADSKGVITADPGDAVAGKVKQELTKSITVTTTKLFKDGLTPKIKVTEKLSGVSVKASKLKKGSTGNGTGTILVKASKSAFKTEGTRKIKFMVTIEGVDKEVEVTYNISK